MRNWSNIIHRHRTMLHPPKPRTREDLLRQNRELTQTSSAKTAKSQRMAPRNPFRLKASSSRLASCYGTIWNLGTSAAASLGGRARG
ncbi:unnamed protein product [Zymoseptoria tritici ST99CH_3D1]|nr:unnamed protein product [Zymoseptoria tritici ST99CH_3D1]